MSRIHQAGRASSVHRPVKKKRASRPPRSSRKRPVVRRGWHHRLAAYIRRKTEEHSHLTQDSMRIALTMVFLFLAFMLANAIYRTWRDNRPSVDPLRHSLVR